MPVKVAVIRGDGIGPEVMEAALGVLDAAEAGEVGHPRLELVECPMGLAVYREHGTPLTDDTFRVLQGCDAILMGAILSPPEPDPAYRPGLLRIRRELELYANIRPARALPNTSAAAPDMDLVLVRENTEGLYIGEEKEMTGGEGAEATRRITRAAGERVAGAAFELAKKEGRSLVTAVHKANVLPLTEGVFLDAVKTVAQEYEAGGIALETMLVDAAAADLVRRPGRYQVLVTTNMFGDILSDLAAQLAGGLGLAPSANIGDKHALFEPVHGGAPDIVGQGIANPTGCILSAAMMLDHLGLRERGDAVRNAVRKVMEDGRHLTPDLGGTATTGEFTAEVVRVLENNRG
jgi:homoisocitrate dehydrogenase